MNKRNVLIGVTGGIAAYKAADLINLLRKRGEEVKVIMTKSAQEFITPLTFQTLTGNKVYLDMFDSERDIKHIELSKWADILIVMPATANIIGKIASGIADDLLSTTVISLSDNVYKFIAPAMNTNMWKNKLLQRNIGILKEKDFVFIPPRNARLACGDYGEGALAKVEDILKEIYSNIKK
jgi:phosphopantothenoylcysteine decarboxylase